MHSCPVCGQACYCHGDIDDTEVETEEYASANCTHVESPNCIPEDLLVDEDFDG